MIFLRGAKGVPSNRGDNSARESNERHVHVVEPLSNAAHPEHAEAYGEVVILTIA